MCGFFYLRSKNWVNHTLQFISSVQLLSHVRFFATPWTAAHQASPSITSSQSLLRLMFIESVMPSNHLILCRPLLHKCVLCAKSLQSCPTLHAMDCSPPGSSAHGILQARILKGVAISFSGRSSWPRDWTPCLLSLLHWQAGSLPLMPPGKLWEWSFKLEPGAANMQGILVRECRKSNGQIGFWDLAVGISSTTLVEGKLSPLK